MSTIKNYTNLADIKDFWKTNIAPNYFNFDNTNNYSIGNFGFVNEVMGTAMEDGQNAINIARREFYPISAKYESSFYKMAAVQRIDLPMATPSTCEVILILDEDLVIEYGKSVGGINQFVIDSSVNIVADKLNFMLDYPVVILSIKNDDGTWSHTTHYDISVHNTLADNDSVSKYVTNKRIRMNGANYIYIKVRLRQIKKSTEERTITVNSTLQSVVMDFPFDGQLANFEVRYKENDNSNPVQLKKLLSGQPIPRTPFCYYNLIGRNKIRITIPKNIYFIPRMNATIELDIYNTEGASGNFDKYDGDLMCEPDPDYPFNTSVIIVGTTDGPAINGKDTPESDEFREEVLDAYATNKTFTTEHDLQVYFDSLDRGTDTKFVIKKKRDDFRWRIYGAFCLCRDSSKEIIPTNTLNLKIAPEQFDVYYESSKRMILRPGTIFRYGENLPDTGEINYNLKRDSSLKISDDLSEITKTDFLFTNPFLISVTLDPNVVGYYLNSVDIKSPLEYSYVNDKSFVQFIARNLFMTRNAIIGENFYKISMALSPSTEIDTASVIDDLDPTLEENVIRAKDRGKLVLVSYKDKTVYGTFVYDNGDVEDIQVGSYITKGESGYEYHPGHTLEISVGEDFQKGSVIARKKVTDKGRLRLIGDINGNLLSNDHYIPFTIEEYNHVSNYYTFVAYLSTNDFVSINKTILIESGVWSVDGSDNVSLSVPIEDFNINFQAYYMNDDVNFPHQYTRYDYFGEYTMTNTYTQREENSLRFVKPLSIIRGKVNFEPKSIIVEDPVLETDLAELNFNYDLEIENVPVIKAEWAQSGANTAELIQSMLVASTKLETAKRRLENSHTFAMMFFNTYGKSRYFKVGIKEDLTTLDSVNCSMDFGLKLSSINTPESTILDIKKYIKAYVESINDLDSSGKSIFIMNLITDVKNAFSEIDYMEYYGFNIYDYRVQKIQGPTEEEITAADALGTYIPEFVNINYEFDGFIYQPMINITLLN